VEDELIPREVAVALLCALEVAEVAVVVLMACDMAQYLRANRVRAYLTQSASAILQTSSKVRCISFPPMRYMYPSTTPTA